MNENFGVSNKLGVLNEVIAEFNLKYHLISLSGRTPLSLRSTLRSFSSKKRGEPRNESLYHI